MRIKNARVYVRRVAGPRKSSVRLTFRPPFLFVTLAVLTALLGLWLNAHIERWELARHIHEAEHGAAASAFKDQWLHKP